jgi:hypothetical protein
MQTFPPLILDEFESGEVTRPRRWAARQIARLFAPPYLPSPLIGYVLLLYLVDSLHMLSEQTVEYWTTWTRPEQGPLLIQMFTSGPWPAIAANLSFALIFAGLLAVLTRKVAFPAWLLASLIFLNLVIGTSDGGFSPFVSLEYTTQSGWLTAGYSLLFSLIWSLGFAGAIKWLVPAWSGKLADRPPALFQISRGALVFFSVICAAAWVSTLAQPRPQWRKIETTQVAPGRYSFSLAYDTHRNRAVMFGGGSRWRPEDLQWYGENDTWEWDGQTWSHIHPSDSPPPRLFAGMAYDEKRGVTVLYGGAHLGIDYNDTWEWNGQNWTQRTPAHNPGPRERFQMIYDPKRGQVIFYGGLVTGKTNNITSDTWYSDAWGWDGTDWTQIPIISGLKLCCYGATYDPLRGAPLLFNEAGLHVWTGNQFVTPSLAFSPRGRSQGALAYDPSHQVVISFGGDKGGAVDSKQQSNDETWQFNGTSWKQIRTADKPPNRLGHALFYDSVRQRILLFGGIGNDTYYNDIWELVLP